MATVLTLSMSSCGTVFGGRISECQKTKPAPGQPKRQIRPFAVVGDLLTAGVWLIVDFVDGGIYKPCNTTASAKK